MTNLLEKIRSRGYWQIVIRPSDFIEKRIPDIGSIYPILNKTYVSFRGWDFPHIDFRLGPKFYYDSIGQDYDWQHHIGAWRFYQSGQFVYVTNISIDWRDQSMFWPADEHWKAGTLLGVSDTLYRFTEIYEFAARLALSSAGGERMCIDVTIKNLEGRVLYMDDRNKWGFTDVFKTSMETYPHIEELTKSDLIARSRDLALHSTRELFSRFGWHITIDSLRDWQNQLIQ